MRWDAAAAAEAAAERAGAADATVADDGRDADVDGGRPPRADGAAAKPRAAPPVVAASPGPHLSSSTTIDVDALQPLSSIPIQEAPSYDSVINFTRCTPRQKSGGATNWCVLCGKLEGTGDDCVTIPKQNKDVCKICDTVTWKHNASGAYFKWCKGCKRFHEIHAFAGKISASKCNGARARGRAYMRNYHAALED